MTVESEELTREILAENERRTAEKDAVFDPYTGEGAPVNRFEYRMPNGLLHGGEEILYLPVTMREELEAMDGGGTVTRLDADAFERLRCRHDFPYWAAKYVKVKNKEGGEDVPFILTRPQRRFVEMLEKMRTAGRPIRVILLKARQWGGSTTTQIYMSWLQLVHQRGLNSLIIAHQSSASYNIKDMFDRMLASYPLAMLHNPGDEYKETEKKLEGVGRTGTIFRIPQRNCKITIGTAERPDSCRGGDYNLVHCSEVGIWKATAGKSPEAMVRSACSGILLRPMTMIVFESTANGVGNYFHREYEAASNPAKKSQFTPLFVPWFEIDLYSMPFAADDDDPAMRSAEAFAAWLAENRHKTVALSEREECGRYLWLLWERGATLEGIHWYVNERRKYSDHGQMASEYPSDDIEAFAHSGERVFDRYKVEALRKECRKPQWRGEVCADGDSGEASLQGLRFIPDEAGALEVWQLPGTEKLTDRYLAVVDIGGRSSKADWSVIAVFDRKPLREGCGPELVAQWRGHTDMDLLAWNATRIASFYDDALLVIESNTLETHAYDNHIEGDQSGFILNEIKQYYSNLYARASSPEEIAEGRPVKYGFHTNVATKPMIISTLVKVIREGLYTERDERCLDEYLTYERKPNGSYGAILGCHDDMLMTRAIGLHISYNEMPMPMKAGQYGADVRWGHYGGADAARITEAFF